MEPQKISNKEKTYLYLYMLGTILIGFAGVTSFPLDVSGRNVPPNQLHAILIASLSIITIIGSILYALKMYGLKDGLKLIFRELWSGLLFGWIIGALVGFFIRAIFYRFGFLIVIGILYSIGVFIIYNTYRKRD